MARFPSGAGAGTDAADGGPLHVTNGASVAGTLRRAPLDGAVISWDDALHEGPLADVDPPALRLLRARFLASCGWGEVEELGRAFAARDRALWDAHERGRRIVLWFEPDLYDQLQLLNVVTALSERVLAPVELVQADAELGPLDEGELGALLPRAFLLGDRERALARAGWHAVCTDDVERFLDTTDTGALPHLRPALERLLEERAEPLSRTKRQLLEELRKGPATPVALFLANQAREEAPFLGDTWCFRHLAALVDAGLARTVGTTSLPEPPPLGDHAAFAGVELELTDAGAALLDG